MFDYFFVAPGYLLDDSFMEIFCSSWKAMFTKLDLIIHRQTIQLESLPNKRLV